MHLELTFDAIHIIKQGTLQHVFHNVKTREEGRGYCGKILINFNTIIWAIQVCATVKGMVFKQLTPG